MRKNRVMLLLGMLCCLNTVTSLFAATPINETYASLSEIPAGAAEVSSGMFPSALLGKEVPYRIFSPINPDLTGQREEGMPIVIYTLNLKCTEPRPSAATDRAIIEDFIKRQFLVVTVDFSGGVVSDHLEWSKDILGLFHVFGGSSYTKTQRQLTANRRKLLNFPGPHEGKEMTSVPFPNGKAGAELPIHPNRVYVIPPGYTVEYHHVFNPDTGSRKRSSLYFDIIYPMPSEENLKLPVLLAQNPYNPGTAIITSSAIILYSWPFNGYALAVTKNMTPAEENAHVYPIVQAIRYLRWKADDFSLNKVVSTTGVSKSARRLYHESNFDGRPTIIDEMPYGKESSKVSVTMPAVSPGLYLDDEIYDDFPIWEHLNEDAPAVVLGAHHLNNNAVEEFPGQNETVVRDAYLAKGWADKVLFRDAPLAAHEYNVYDLNDIMAFWDKFCK